MRLRRQHVAATVIVVLAHAAVFSLFTRLAPEPPRDETPWVEASLIDGAAFGVLAPTNPAPKPPSPPRSPEPPAPTTPPPVEAPAAGATVATPTSPLGPVDLAAQPIAVGDPAPQAPPLAAGLAGGAVCDLTAKVQTGMQADPAVRQALRSLPRTERSVANAVKVWDGGWIAEKGTNAESLWAPLREPLRAILQEASVACLEAPMTGPRLVLVRDDRENTTILAFGAGEWRWQAVADDLPAKDLPGVFTRLFGFR